MQVVTPFIMAGTLNECLSVCHNSNGYPRQHILLHHQVGSFWPSLAEKSPEGVLVVSRGVLSFDLSILPSYIGLKALSTCTLGPGLRWVVRSSGYA